MNIDNKKFMVADIKQKYMSNIIDAAQKCDFIDRIVLFGSSIRDTCRETSDIDIAVFGTLTRTRALCSKKFERFARQLYSMDDHTQSYDILYFKSGSGNSSHIMNDIMKGEIIYER